VARRSIFLAGLAILALVWIALISNLLGSDEPANLVAAESKNNLTISQAMAVGSLPNLPVRNAENAQFTLFGTVSGFSGDVESVIYSGDEISTQDMGKRVVVGVPQGSLSIVALFANSQARMSFQDSILLNLVQGSVYVQPGEGANAEVQFASFQDAAARVQGSRMVVKWLNTSEVLVQCFEGKCEFHLPPAQNWTAISVGAERVFNLVKGQAGNETLMTFTEMWDSNIGCGFCLTAILPTPVPTNTPFPTLTATSIRIYPSATTGEVAQSQSSGQRAATAVPPTSAPVITAPVLPLIPPTLAPQPKPNNQPPQPKLKPDPGPPKPKGNGNSDLKPCKPSKNKPCP
jgi:hypothetical protein